MNKIRTITVARIGSHRTVKFAVDELRRYLKQIDSDVIVDVRLYDDYNGDNSDLLWVGMADEFDKYLPGVKERELDDAIHIDVKDFVGVITGNNYRSVLIAVYRFLRELGVCFVHPGEDGEIVPRKTLDTCDVNICEAATSRHRFVCIEGATAYEHIRNMIDWLPKVGLNGYQMQFFTPKAFLSRWHEHSYNASLGVDNITREEATRVLAKAEEDIAERSLQYVAIGHGWTTESFGVRADGWDRIDPSEVPADVMELFAQIDGKRGLFKNTPASTQLCYTNPKAIEMFAKTVADYCESHPQVSIIEVALADGSKNYCECENCRDFRPSDLFVNLVNRINELMEKRGIQARMMISNYNDKGWAPVKYKLNNPSRVILQSAPITRPYTMSYADLDPDNLGELPEFVLNKFERLRELPQLMHQMQDWMAALPGVDTTVYDYHLWFTPLLCDAGRFFVSKVLLRDIEALPKFGINGFISCQVQREGFPTNLPMAVMSRSLWDNTVKFETVVEDQLKAEFGNEYKTAIEYLETLSELLTYWPHRLAEPDVVIDEEKRINCEKALEHITKFKPTIEKIASGEFECPLQAKMWRYLCIHTEISEIIARLNREKFLGKTPDERREIQLEYHNFFRRTEPELHRVLDLSRQLMNTGAGAE